VPYIDAVRRICHSCATHWHCAKGLPQLCHTLTLCKGPTTAVPHIDTVRRVYHSCAIHWHCAKGLPQLCHTLTLFKGFTTHWHCAKGLPQLCHTLTLCKGFTTAVPHIDAVQRVYHSCATHWRCAKGRPQLCHTLTLCKGLTTAMPYIRHWQFHQTTNHSDLQIRVCILRYTNTVYEGIQFALCNLRAEAQFYDMHRAQPLLKSIRSDLLSLTSPQDAPFVSVIHPWGEGTDHTSLWMDFRLHQCQDSEWSTFDPLRVATGYIR
jgi:hypothetical protein